MINNIFGLPGSGKTTFLAWAADRALRGKFLRCGSIPLQSIPQYKAVFSNFPLKGAMRLDLETLGYVAYPDSLLLIDESVLLADSRDYKSLDKNLMMALKQHRKYNQDCWFSSQGYRDNDLRIRDLYENVFYIQSKPFGRSTMYSVEKDIEIAKDIKDTYELGGLFHRKTIIRKNYYHLFDTMYIHGTPLPPYDIAVPW